MVLQGFDCYNVDLNTMTYQEINKLAGRFVWGSGKNKRSETTFRGVMSLETFFQNLEQNRSIM